jgi:hypothetical protein
MKIQQMWGGEEEVDKYGNGKDGGLEYAEDMDMDTEKW